MDLPQPYSQVNKNSLKVNPSHGLQEREQGNSIQVWTVPAETITVGMSQIDKGSEEDDKLFLISP
jgi:hypothetical protein